MHLTEPTAFINTKLGRSLIEPLIIQTCRGGASGPAGGRGGGRLRRGPPRPCFSIHSPAGALWALCAAGRSHLSSERLCLLRAQSTLRRDVTALCVPVTLPPPPTPPLCVTGGRGPQRSTEHAWCCRIM